MSSKRNEGSATPPIPSEVLHIAKRIAALSVEDQAWLIMVTINSKRLRMFAHHVSLNSKTGRLLMGWLHGCASLGGYLARQLANRPGKKTRPETKPRNNQLRELKRAGKTQGEIKREMKARGFPLKESNIRKILSQLSDADEQLDLEDVIKDMAETSALFANEGATYRL